MEEEKNYYYEFEACSLNDYLNIILRKKHPDFSQQKYFEITSDPIIDTYSYNFKGIYKDALDYNMSQFSNRTNSVEFDFIEFLYRGHSDVNYKLTPSVFRINVDEDYLIKSILSFLPSEFEYNDVFSILTKLQHYGCPSRLLDLTENALVALYFACCSNESKDGVVLCFPIDYKDIIDSGSESSKLSYSFSLMSNGLKQKLYEDFRNNYDNLIDSSKNINDLIPSDVKLLFSNNGINLNKLRYGHFVYPRFIRPKYDNVRVKAQSGIFLTCALYDVNTNNIHKLFERAVYCRIIIPAADKKNILKELDMCGINKMTLFDDIKSAADYLISKKANRTK